MRKQFIDIIANPAAALKEKGLNPMATLFRQILVDRRVDLSRIYRLMDRFLADDRNNVGSTPMQRSQQRNNISGTLAKKEMTAANLMIAFRLLRFTQVDLIARCYGPREGVVTESIIAIPFSSVEDESETEATESDAVEDTDESTDEYGGLLSEDLIDVLRGVCTNSDEEELIEIGLKITDIVERNSHKALRQKV